VRSGITYDQKDTGGRAGAVQRGMNTLERRGDPGIQYLTLQPESKKKTRIWEKEKETPIRLKGRLDTIKTFQRNEKKKGEQASEFQFPKGPGHAYVQPESTVFPLEEERKA